MTCIFLGMSDWDFAAAYLDEHILWLGSKLEEYKDERCFIITHLFFPGLRLPDNLRRQFQSK